MPSLSANPQVAISDYNHSYLANTEWRDTELFTNMATT